MRLLCLMHQVDAVCGSALRNAITSVRVFSGRSFLVLYIIVPPHFGTETNGLPCRTGCLQVLELAWPIGILIATGVPRQQRIGQRRPPPAPAEPYIRVRSGS